MNNPIQMPPKPSSFKQSLLFFLGGAVVGGVFCAGVLLSHQSKQAVVVSNVVGESLFKVDNSTYLSTNLPADVAMTYYQLENSIYDAKANMVNQIALRVALAKDASKSTTDALPSLDTLLPASTPSDAELKSYYDSIASRYGASVFGGQSYDALKGQLSQQLARQNREKMIQEKIKEFTDLGRISTLLVRPEAPPVQLNLTGYPVRGNAGSATTLVAVSDYMCPHCREVEPAVEKVFNEFKDKIKFVQVVFPLQANGLNGALARGAFCANKQGQEKFWKYHEQAFQVSWNKLTPPKDKDASGFYNAETAVVAEHAGLDVNAFNSCLVSDAATQYITRLQSEFNAEKGFRGTPTFYLNNRLIQTSPDRLEATLRQTLTQIAAK